MCSKTFKIHVKLNVLRATYKCAKEVAFFYEMSDSF